MLQMKVTGLDSIERSLRNLQKRADDLSGSKPADDVLTPEFLSANTPFEDIGALLEAGGFSVASQADFDAIPEGQLDAHIRAVSRFSSWREMLSAGAVAYMKREMQL